MREQQENVWQLQKAKAKFSAFVRAAELYPQTVTIHGKSRVIMLSWPYFRQMMKDVIELERRSKTSSPDENLTSLDNN